MNINDINLNKNEILNEFSKFENLSLNKLNKYIKSFEKLIKYESKKYRNIFGLEDYRLHKFDYKILYFLYINTLPSQNKLKLLLYFIYSYYKMDGIDYNYFPINLFFNFLHNNPNIYRLILSCF